MVLLLQARAGKSFSAEGGDQQAVVRFVAQKIKKALRRGLQVEQTAAIFRDEYCGDFAVTPGSFPECGFAEDFLVAFADDRPLFSIGVLGDVPLQSKLSVFDLGQLVRGVKAVLFELRPARLGDIDG